MSRSYKHTPRCGDKKSKFVKNQANRKIRRNKNITPFNKSYRKYHQSWDICDYESVGTSFNEYRRYNTGFINEEDLLKSYKKYFINK